MSTENVNEICNMDFVLCQSKAVVPELRSDGTQMFHELSHDHRPLKSSNGGAFPVSHKRIKVVDKISYFTQFSQSFR
jgi:hypothetical protein